MKHCHCPGVAKKANTRYMSRRPSNCNIFFASGYLVKLESNSHLNVTSGIKVGSRILGWLIPCAVYLERDLIGGVPRDIEGGGRGDNHGGVHQPLIRQKSHMGGEE